MNLVPKFNRKVFIWCLCLFAAGLFNYQAASAQHAEEVAQFSPRIKPAPDSVMLQRINQLASAFIDAIADDYNVSKLSALCTVPFAFDKEVLITDTDDLMEHFQSLAAHKKHKSFTLLETKTEIVRIWQEIAAYVVPVSVAIVKCRCTLSMNGREGKNTVTLAVSLTSTPKVIGLSD